MDKKQAKELELLEKIKAHLEDGQLAKTFEVGDDEDDQEWFASYNLLTAKPVIYAANVSEDDLADDGANNPHVANVRKLAAEEGSEVLLSVHRLSRRSRNWMMMRKQCSWKIWD